jgi:membrane protein
VSALDGFQRRHHSVGFPVAVIYKFVDDQGSYLTALITFYGFLSLFPLLLLLVTILGFFLHGDPDLQARLLDSALGQFPIVGSQLRENVHARTGSGLAVVVGVLVTLYGCLGAAQATQNALNRAWAVPRNERPNPIKSRLRSLLLVAVLGLGVLVTTGLSGLTTGAGALGATVAGEVGAIGIVLAMVTNVGLFMLAFRVLTAGQIPARELRLSAVVAGIGWGIVQILGTYFLSHFLKGTRETYGVFGLVLGLIAWIYLFALVTVVATEINVVAQRKLWPRALLTPFTDNVELTAADERSYTSYAEAERHKSFQSIDVGFGQPESEDGDAEPRR